MMTAAVRVVARIMQSGARTLRAQTQPRRQRMPPLPKSGIESCVDSNMIPLHAAMAVEASAVPSAEVTVAGEEREHVELAKDGNGIDFFGNFLRIVGI